MYLNAMKAKIHIAKAELAMADADYRAMLQRVCNKTSCARMNRAELDAVLAEMRRLGFVPQKPQPREPAGRQPLVGSDCAKLLGKIRALLLDNGWGWNYAHGTADKMFGKRLETCTAAEMHKVVSALQMHANRLKKRKGDA